MGRATEANIILFNVIPITVAFIGNTFARCTLCCSDFNISHGGRNDVTTHINGKKHKALAADASATQSVAAFFRPEVSKGVIEAETR